MAVSGNASSVTAAVVPEDAAASPLFEGPLDDLWRELLKKLSSLDCWCVSSFVFFFRGTDDLEARERLDIVYTLMCHTAEERVII